MKMLKRTAALVLAIAMTVCLAGCGKKYEMTEADLELQSKLVGFWGADDSTGYNEYDDEGNITSGIFVEFTEDFYQRTHQIVFSTGMLYSYEAVPYTIENCEFKVIENGSPSYAGVKFNKDASEMTWTANGKDDLFLKMSNERAAQFGLVPYDHSAAQESGANEE